jgi:hypothetical protein
MGRIARMGILGITFAMSVLSVPLANAKKAPDEPSAPVPTQVLNGRRIFISYGESDADPGAPNLTYNEFYALMKTWGKYELTSGPADADLIFEIRFLSGISDSQLRLSIVDPKTHVVLWPFIQHVESSSRETARRKKFDEAMGDLVEDVKRVTSQASAAGK